MTSEREREFDALYKASTDPWGFETSAYEAEKYTATLAALPHSRFRNALEVGCSIGVLSARLAARCDSLTALDVSKIALDRARSRKGMQNVSFLHAEVPREWPQATYDLVVVSEVLYFLDKDEIATIATCIARDLAQDGVCIAVNYTGENDRPLSGTEAARLFAQAAKQHGLHHTLKQDADRYRLDMLARQPQT